MCVPFPLDLDRRITFAFGFGSFRLGSRVGAFACPCSLGGLHRLPLCSSSLRCVASFCSVGFLLLASFLPRLVDFSPPFLLLTSFVIVARCVLCPSLPLVFHFAVLGSSPVAWWPSVLFWPCSSSFLAWKLLLLSRVFSSSC